MDDDSHDIPAHFTTTALNGRSLAPLIKGPTAGARKHQPVSSVPPRKEFTGAGTAADPIDPDGSSQTHENDSEVVHDGVWDNGNSTSPHQHDDAAPGNRSRARSIEIVYERLVEKKASSLDQSTLEFSEDDSSTENGVFKFGHNQVDGREQKWPRLRNAESDNGHVNQQLLDPHSSATTDRKNTVADIMPGESAVSPPCGLVPRGIQKAYPTSLGSHSLLKRKSLEQKQADHARRIRSKQI